MGEKERLTDSSRGLSRKIREIFAKNLRKICEYYANFSRIFREFFATDHVKSPLVRYLLATVKTQIHILQVYFYLYTSINLSLY